MTDFSCLRALFYTALSGASVAFTVPVHAQSVSSGTVSANTADEAGTGNQKASHLDQVVVTGRAGIDVRSKQQVSYSITTIDEDRLRMQAPISVTDSLKSVPGFWVESSGGVASGNIRARGIPVDGFGSITLLEDGVPVQHDPALGYLNADQAFRLDETIERIEVVRGGPSSIFYSNAPAGAVNYIPRQVGDEPEGLFKYTVGNYGLNRADFWYGAPAGKWKMAVGGFYRVDDGIRDPGYRADDGGQIRFTLSRDLEHGKFSFDVKHLDDQVAFYTGIPMYKDSHGDIRAVPGINGNYGTIAGPETEHLEMITGGGGRYDFDNSEGTHVKRDQLTLKLDQTFGDGWKLSEAVRYDKTHTQRNGVFPLTLQSAASFLDQEQGQLAAYPGASALQLRYVDNPSQVFDVANQNGNGLMLVNGLRGVTMPLHEFIDDTRLSRKFDLGGSHDVTIGYYYAGFSQDFNRYSSSVLTDVKDQARLLDLVAVDASGHPVATLTDNGVYRYGYEWANASGESDTHAFYAADDWQITPQLRIDAGARWENVRVRGSTERSQTVDLGTPATSSILTGTGVFDHYDNRFSKLGWTLGANWQFSRRSGIFARWTPTFRLPNLSSYITNPTATPKTQTMDLGEIGYKFTDRMMDAYATLFYTKYNNVGFSNYVYDADSGVSTVQQGYADTKTWGLELEGGFYPVDWFDVRYDATLQNPKYKGLRYTQVVDGEPVLVNYVDNQLIRVPKVSLRVVPGLNLIGGTLRLQLAYEWEGKRYVDTANSVVLPSYHKLDFSARYALTPDLSLFAYVDNLTNSEGLTEGNPRAGELESADAGANSFIARPLLGRTFRFSVMYRF